MTMICSQLARIPIHKKFSHEESYDDHHRSALKPEEGSFFFLTGEICQKLKLKMKI
jgi:hypothetical protein